MIKKNLRTVVSFDDLVDLCDGNFLVVMRHVNAHEDKINDLVSTMDKLTKKCKHKASKLGLFLTIAAGITYVVKNELDKQDIKENLIAMDKAHRYSNCTEDEGDAIEPLGI